MIALFVGRFQPFHLGHLKAIKEILRENEKVIIVIGSSQESRTEENPFSFWERRKMIEDSLNSEGIGNFEITGMRDFHDDRKWVSELKKRVSFGRVYSRNPKTIRCFEGEGIKVERHRFYERKKYNATEIRRRISRGMDWEGLVPAPVADYIKRKGKAWMK